MVISMRIQTVKMQLLLVAVGLVVAASAEYHRTLLRRRWHLEEDGIWRDYHEEFGIAEAARIKQAELSMDFDGARIVGGSTSSLGQHPHLGGLIVELADGRESVCCSSLLTHTRLVTAAHCWRHGQGHARQVTVVLGSIRLYSGGTRVTSSNVHVHPNYVANIPSHDIAIIVTSWIGFTNHIRHIALASGSNTFAGITATASGFGRTGDNQNIAQNQSLRHVTMKVITNLDCADWYGRVITPSVLCTDTTGGRSVCRGDSGGPLDVGTGHNRQLIGISLFTRASGCEGGHPAGFARVTSFYSWIHRHL